MLAMNKRSCVIVEANASANPANDGEMPGDINETSAIAPTMPVESRLKRIESHRLTREKIRKMLPEILLYP